MGEPQHSDDKLTEGEQLDGIAMTTYWIGIFKFFSLLSFSLTQW